MHTPKKSDPVRAAEIAAFLAREGAVLCPPGSALPAGYVMQQARLASLNKVSGKTTHRSRSLFFKRGAGCI
jgi:hypothetical protein